jgi:quercetin dioxygenase-like cupin family protein
MSEPLWFLGTLVLPKAWGEETGGRFAMWEHVFPHRSAPPVHTHPQDETNYVLAGRVTFWLDGEVRVCEPGDAVVALGGTPHAFRVESGTARMLLVSTPAGIDGFIRDLAEPAAWPWLPPPPDGPRVSEERLDEVFRKHGVEILGPPPS